MNELVFYFPDGHRGHTSQGHVERPERLDAIRLGLEKSGDAASFPFLPPIDLPRTLLETIHTETYLGQLQLAAQNSRFLDSDTYTTPDSYQLALNSAGGAVSVAQQVWTQDAQRGFALCRPPGHHATRTHGMGFCLLNNIAMAGGFLLSELGAQRLAIIDLDLHHGNGTQDIFYSSGDVFYFSTHRYPFYPGSGRLEEMGIGHGEGKTANFPLPTGSGDLAIRVIIKTLIIPLLDRFEPEMLLVSAGFDTHWRDPLGDMLMTAAGYGEAIRLLSEWADLHCLGRIALFLEGGYDLMAVTACTLASTRALLNEEIDDQVGPAPVPEQEGWRPMVRQATNVWDLEHGPQTTDSLKN